MMHDQTLIGKTVTLQELIVETPQTQPDSEPRLEDVFAPLYGESMTRISAILKERIFDRFLDHGIELSDDPLVIHLLDLPDEVVDAYQDLVNGDFNSTARSKFIQRMRVALPGVTAEHLIPLVYNDVSEVRTIFANGVFHPDMFYPGQMYDLQAPNRRKPPEISTDDSHILLPKPDNIDVSSQGQDIDHADSTPRPLKDEDMNMLKRL